MCQTAGCTTRKATGFTLTQHVSPCPDAPIGVCTDCGHDIVLGEEWNHEDCDINITAAIEEALAEAEEKEAMPAA